MNSEEIRVMTTAFRHELTKIASASTTRSLFGEALGHLSHRQQAAVMIPALATAGAVTGLGTLSAIPATPYELNPDNMDMTGI